MTKRIWMLVCLLLVACGVPEERAAQPTPPLPVTETVPAGIVSMPVPYPLSDAAAIEGIAETSTPSRPLRTFPCRRRGRQRSWH